MTFKGKLARYKRALVSAHKANQRVSALRQELAADCQHPPEFVVEYRWEHDNGYGSQSMCTGRTCQVCGVKDPYRRLLVYPPA